MPSLVYKQHAYGGTTSTATDAAHVLADDGSGVNVTAQQLFENILGDLATVEPSSTASKAYGVGDYLILNSYLYRVTEPIASGNTIVPNTNVVQTTIGETINPIVQNIFENVEQSTTASKAYAVGNYLIYDGKIYKVTEAISLGDTIVPNSNIVQTSIDETFEVVNSNIKSIFTDFATVEQSTTASKAYAVGDYLIYDRNLYKVLESIAAGGKIKTGLEPGSVFVKVTRTTVGEEIPKFLHKSYNKSYTVSATASASISINVDKLGYTPLVVRSFDSNNSNVLTYYLQFDNYERTVEVGLRNVSSSSVTDSYYIDVLYVTEVSGFVNPVMFVGD